MGEQLEEYRRKRDADRTPEPMPEQQAGPEEALPEGRNDTLGEHAATFVIQQHHARRLHWDLRLERDGVLVSWALPRGVPRDPADNHLAVHTEDHPLEYAAFHGQIPEGEYGAGRMTIYDRGTYATEKWREDEVIVALRGGQVSGRYVLFHTRGKDWIIHRMDPPDPGWSPMPERIAPMRATRARKLPADDAAWGFEMTWDGHRAAAHVSTGRVRLVSDDDRDVTGSYPELRALMEALAPTECVLDGEVVAFDADGRVSGAALQSRRETTGADAARRRASRTPVQYLVFDLLWLEGKSLVDLPYRQRRELLAELGLAGPSWQTPPHFTGGGPQALRTSREQGLSGVTAKRLDAPYLAGRRSRHWLEVSSPTPS
jgi:bifunctional non-homologous end joining protein LigD